MHVRRPSWKIALILLLPMLVYNNCTPSKLTPQAPTDAVLPGIDDPTLNLGPVVGGGTSQHNGGGHSGKISFAAFDATPLCGPASMTPEQQIVVGPYTTVLTQNTCSSSTSSTIDNQQIYKNPYDPNYIVYNERVFINEAVIAKKGADHRVLMRAFCTNPDYSRSADDVRGLDIAIRTELRWSGGQWNGQAFGQMIQGHSDQSATITDVAGSLPESTSGPDHDASFIASGGAYRLDFAAGSAPTRSIGTLTLRSGEVVTMECFRLWIKK